MSPLDTCLNCGTILNGKFCHTCGQKKIEDKERTLKHFFYQFFGAAFFLENNLIRSLWLLLSRPGFLAAEYLEGRRKRYMAPISLFLLINLVYFFTVSLTDMNLSLAEQIRQPQHGWLAEVMIEKRLDSREMKFEEYASAYNEQSTSLSKTLIILHAPILAAMLTLLFVRKKYYFTDHLVFSLYMIAFVLLLSIILFALFRFLAKTHVIAPRTFFSWIGYAQLVIYPVYFGFALRRFYRLPVWLTLLSTVAVMILIILAHFIYRTLLFFIVFWTT